MSLWEDMMEPCQLWELQRVSDGEGGYTRAWAPTECFDAAVVLNNSAQDRIAEKQGLATTWTVTTGFELAFHDVFKRVKDGKTFQVTSDALDSKTPTPASFQFNQCTCEEFDTEVL